MTELIRRRVKTERISIMDIAREMGIPLDRLETQVSINDWGHLTIRFFKGPSSETPPYIVAGDEAGGEESDILVVFDRETTRRIVDFVMRICRGDC